jgi:hypothetical protein
MDIVERLLSLGGIEGTMRWYINPDGQEAADEIERLREALKKMNDEQCQQVDMTKQKSIEDTRKETIARAALKGDE